MTLVLARNRASSLAAVLLGLVIGSGSFAAAQDQGGPRRPGGRDAPPPQQPQPDAQPSAPPERPAVPQAHAVPDGVMQVYPLKHVSADSLATIIPTVLSQSRIAIDNHTNAIVLLASAADHEKAAALIARLDVESDAPRGMATHILQSPTNVDDDLRALLNVVVSRQARVAHRDRLIVITGTQADADAVKRVLEEVAREREQGMDARSESPLQVEAYFLSVRVGAASDAAPSLPAALKPVAQALTESGFGSASLLAPFQVSLTGDGRQFQLGGQAPGSKAPLSISLEGLGGRGPTPDSVRLDLQATVEARLPAPAERSNMPMPHRAPQFQLRTTIQANLGEYVVVAASPASPESDEAIALVIRVTAAR